MKDGTVHGHDQMYSSTYQRRTGAEPTPRKINSLDGHISLLIETRLKAKMEGSRDTLSVSSLSEVQTCESLRSDF